jgi:hypothetical protein
MLLDVTSAEFPRIIISPRKNAHISPACEVCVSHTLCWHAHERTDPRDSCPHARGLSQLAMKCQEESGIDHYSVYSASKKCISGRAGEDFRVLDQILDRLSLNRSSSNRSAELVLILDTESQAQCMPTVRLTIGDWERA